MTMDAAIWASLPVPVLILDPEDKIADVNPAAEGFLNASTKSLVGSPVWDRLAINALMDEAMSRARRHEAPLFVNDVDVGTGERAPVQCNLQIAPLLESPGQMLLIISPRELGGRAAQGHAAQSAAKSAIGMAEMLAHEIKNPLAGITGAAQLLEMNLTADEREITDLIVGECRRIVKLLEQVEQFGDLSRPKRMAVNLHDVLDRARRSALLGFGAHMQITESYDPSLPLAQADADQLLQVILNLLKNASEAAGSSGGAIHLRTYFEHSVRLRRAGGDGPSLPLQIEISDDGPGLPAEIAEDVFDPFVSGRENGTGLGLALVSKIIAEHDGLISLESAPGRTVVRISLPVAPLEQDTSPMRKG